MSEEEPVGTTTDTRVSGWLHLMPRMQVSDMERSIAYYQEALGRPFGVQESGLARVCPTAG